MVISTWSIPQRRQGSRLLAPLPIDVYLLIFDQFTYDAEIQSLAEYKASLVHLTLVCRFFNAMVTPKLFKDIILDGDDDTNDPGCNTTQCRWLERAIHGDENASTLMAKVKNLSLHNWRDEDDPDEWREGEWKDVIHDAFPHFSSLTHLYVLRTPITSDFVTLIYQLPHLETLHIKECVFSSEGPPSQLHPDQLQSRPLRLREFQLGHIDNFGRYRKAMAIYVATPALRVLKTSDAGLAYRIMEQASEVPLQCLEMPLKAEDTSILSAFLNRTPTITDLWLESGCIEDEELPPLPRLHVRPDALPHLRELHCPTAVLPQLLPKRPVVTLNLVESQDWMFTKSYENIDLNPLSKDKVPYLQELVVPYAMYSELPLHKYIPKIDTLVVCLPLVLSALPCRGILRALCTVHEQKPTVRHLKLLPFGGINVVWAFDLVYQHELITELLSPSFPSAMHISLNEGIEWHFTPELKAWKPIMLAPELYRSLLSSGEQTFWMMVNATDFEGLFINLFKPNDLTEDIMKRLGASSASTGAQKVENGGAPEPNCQPPVVSAEDVYNFA